MKQNKNSTILTFAFIALSIFLVSCSSGTGPINKRPTDTKTAQFESSQVIKKFSSPNEIAEFLQKNSVSQGDRSYGAANFGMRAMAAAESAGASAKSAAAPSSAASDSGSGAADYSQTNVQVKGVDEADFIKNDGKYIYTLSGNKLVIVDAYPAENAKILSEIKIDGNARNIFVNGDRLAVFADGNDQSYAISQYDYMPRPTYVSKTHVFLYDISDRKNPQLLKDYNINGYYFDSRMVGDHVYFISKENANYYGGFVDVPLIKQSSKIVSRPDVFYFDNPEDNFVFHTISSFDIKDTSDAINSKTFMLGYSDNMYVSENSIYITYQKNFPYTYYQEHNKERFFDVIVPLLPADAQSEIKSINDDTSISTYEKWDKISSAFEKMYNKMDESQKSQLNEKMNAAVEQYELKLEQERRKTIIQKIGIDNGKIEYKARGEVSGSLLNQFSMDETNGHFRVATTTYVYAKDTTMYNNVYVLDNVLKVVGKLEDIAPEERIYSTRFIGDRLYMVTFKNVDPLFVIDLSNPENPKMLGELKIPGFSDYLHPYDETHIIGIGKDTEANQWGGVSTSGLKLALFDVSDATNPKQVATYTIGKAGTDSEALNEHKAFLFEKDKNLLVIPVREVKERHYDGKMGYYKNNVWQGAYVFGLTPEAGFKLKGKVTHEDNETQNYYYYGSPNAVRRSLFMDDVLYTISQAKIKANDLNNANKEIKDIELPYDEQEYPHPYYGGTVTKVQPSVVGVK